ncbi:CRISPR-associated helicase Cas3' [Garciella nitratireducens]|uniref:CRISPR-associated helicase Cas3' n=1 Tax=Garciella nitratireducens TaxID=218205 RepID=UPI000DE9E924|nr:CRISPR-associated helicase Cas3' [Garciella nitratireducens]RBP38223.1 CRISPR-associated Cas3 family helicase [Garciella nitratireducens]
MRTEYIAKTYPEQETIQQHTDRLIENYNILKKIYPDLKVDWDILELACIYHDLGKMNRKFQEKIRGKRVKDEIPHGFLSIGFLDVYGLEKIFSEKKIKILVNSIAYHHERGFRFSEYDKFLEEEIMAMKEKSKDFKYDRAKNCFETLNIDILDYLDGSRVTEEDGQDVFYDYILVKGLLNRIDYAASAHEKVERENNFLDEALDNMMKNWRKENEKASWNDLQKYMIFNRDENIIAVAQTGMGKTEAGLLWIGNNKGFFTLPLKTAINAIYDRVRNHIVKDKVGERVGLLHSDAFSEYIKREDAEEDKLELEEVGLSQYHERTKQLTMPLTICTIDQLFDFIYRYKGFEPKLATLAYSKIIIDEIQMYSSDLIAYLVSGLLHITKLGGKFAILTATFPPFIGDLLEKEGVKFKNPEPFIDKDGSKIRHSIKVKDEMINADFIIENYNKNKVLVICNTVKKAQELYEEIKKRRRDLKQDVNLFHSSFIKRDRKDKEKAILDLGKKDNVEGHGIWICTQVAEASLDIDFDVLITELSDLNGLFQRMGRCYRNRSFNKEGYNCYVFNGGEKECTGVGYVIDKDIFKFSKEALKNIDGKISEEEKIDLINNVYTTEKLGKTEYYKKIINTLKYIESLYTNEMDKSQAKKMFRNINSITVIPEEVFKENRDEIEKCKEIINQKRNEDMTEKELEEFKVRKAKARSKLTDYTVSIPFYLVNNKNTQYFEINKYENVTIFKCNYDKEQGLTPIKDLVEEKEKGNWNNIV